MFAGGGQCRGVFWEGLLTFISGVFFQIACEVSILHSFPSD